MRKSAPTLFSMRPIRRNSLVDQVSHQIREVVDKRRLQSGDRLPSEPELVSQLGVSRTVIREAVGRLETIGLLSVQKGRGIFVGDRSGLASCVKLISSAMTISPKELQTFSEFRAAIECVAARRAAELATPDDVAELEKLCEQMYSKGRKPMDAVRLDFAFHTKLAEIADNELIVNVMQVMHEFIMAGIVQTLPQAASYDMVRQEHLDILEGIRAGNPDLAEAAMKLHMARLDHHLREIEQELE